MVKFYVSDKKIMVIGHLHFNNLKFGNILSTLCNRVTVSIKSFISKSDNGKIYFHTLEISRERVQNISRGNFTPFPIFSQKEVSYTIYHENFYPTKVTLKTLHLNT